MFDLYYFSFHVTDQIHQPELPGILVSPPIKKGSRTRDGDMVILSLLFAGKNPYSPAELDQLLQRSAVAYYKSSGSLTAGMRAAAEICNAQLVERNLKSARVEGGQAIGRLNIAVLRDDTLFLAVAGPAHTFVLGAEGVEDFYDPQAGRGLGAGTAVSLRYFQSRVQAGDVLVFSPEPPAAWTPANLAGSPALTLEHLRRRLLNGIGPNLQAVVFKFQTGSGEVHALRHRSASTGAAPAMAHPPTADRAVVEPAAPRASDVLPATPIPAPARTPAQPVETVRASAAPVAAPAPLSQPDPLEAARLARQRRIERKQKAANAWAGWKKFTTKLNTAWEGLLTRLAPQRTVRSGSGEIQASGRVSPAVLVLIAIAVPLVVVAIALTVYLQTGRGEQRMTYYQQAIIFSNQALAQKDPLAQRNNWVQVLEWLDKADEYGTTEDTRALRQRAQQGVDAVDAVTRLSFSKVSRVALANSVKVSRMVANGDDLYLLDSSNGSILRMFLTAQGYELDDKFSCGPGPSGSLFIRPLVDLSPMPPVNIQNATVAAMDDSGNLIYCIPGKQPVTRPLAAPNIGWGKITSMAMMQDSLYVLDVLANAVWKYASKDLYFQERPTLFSEPFNLSLANAVDLAFYEDIVYFLRGDGKITRCTISRVKDLPSRCDDPAHFSDSRPAHEKSPIVMPGALFTQIQAINAPDPSLYLLDTRETAVYRFSVVLNFQEQMRPSGLTETPLPKKAPTAFTITPRRIVFLAYDNQLFMAQMP